MPRPVPQSPILRSIGAVFDADGQRWLNPDTGNVEIIPAGFEYNPDTDRLRPVDPNGLPPNPQPPSGCGTPMATEDEAKQLFKIPAEDWPAMSVKCRLALMEAAALIDVSQSPVVGGNFRAYIMFGSNDNEETTEQLVLADTPEHAKEYFLRRYDDGEYTNISVAVMPRERDWTHYSPGLLNWDFVL